MKILFPQYEIFILNEILEQNYLHTIANYLEYSIPCSGCDTSMAGHKTSGSVYRIFQNSRGDSHLLARPFKEEWKVPAGPGGSG